MDLPDLLEPERIRCRCDIHSKKRALQTVAELLGEALRRSGAPEGGASTPSDASAAASDGTTGSGSAAADARRDTPLDVDARVRGESPAHPPASARGASERPAEGGGRGLIGRGGKGGRGGRRKGAAPAGEGEGGGISDMDILDALISRERLGSTGLGHGVALPHSRLELVDAPLAAMITLNEGVDFEAGDGEPVDLVLGLLVPQDCNDEHLKILANLARRFSDAELREALREHDSGQELFEHLQRLASEP